MIITSPATPNRPRSRWFHAGRATLVAALVAALLLVAPNIGNVQATEGTLFGTATPPEASADDDAPVEVGVRFHSAVDGLVTDIRFYKSALNAGPHTGTLWRGDGTKLSSVRFRGESATGWQTARFDEPVRIEAGSTYIASYQAPNGHYSVGIGGLDQPVSRGGLTVPAGGGVFVYGAGGYPTQTFRNANYYVDVVFRKGATGSSPPQPSPEPVAAGELALPRIPWEGGPAYWKKFSKTDAAGWDDPAFFPIVSWFGNVSSDEEVAYDKSLGINTYSGMWEGTVYRLFEDNGVFWVGSKLNETFADDAANWVGHFLDDEVDGRYPIAEGQAHLQSLVDAIGDDGRFRYANFTQMVVGSDLDREAAETYVNAYTDVVSTDMYWYTIPYCDQEPYRDVYLVPVDRSNCRTASSYGKMMNSLRIRDAADGVLQPLWQWVENLNGGPGEEAPVVHITPDQLKGAVMNSVLNEARGIAYFNQSLGGPCTTGNVFRQSQVVENFCGASQVDAVRSVNAVIHSLARVINTQSYDYSFGAGLDTMLKTFEGSAYIFAMIDGSSGPGERTFQLPEGVRGTRVDVLDENRSLEVDDERRFSDEFGLESSYHVYRVSLD